MKFSLAKIKVTAIRFFIFALFIVGWHLTQHYIEQTHLTIQKNNEIHDLILIASTGINEYLVAHHYLTALLLILTSFFIDASMLILIAHSLFSKTTRWFIGLAIVMILRQLCQVLVTLPLPQGLLWFYPGFPSLFVTYGVSTDLFFSGHSASAVYLVLALIKIFTCSKIWRIFLYLIMVTEIALVLVLRVHYFMDVYAGIMTAIVGYMIAKNLKLPVWLEGK
jgi:hypothetical protein